jgi:hypothetical protein
MYQTGIGIIIHHTIMPGILFLCTDTETYSVSLNINNNYNYVNYRRSNQAVVLYNSRRSNGYERQHPNNNFSRRNTNVSNRYELEQRRSNRNEINYSQKKPIITSNTSQRGASQRDISQNRNQSAREKFPKGDQRDYSQKKK